MSYGPPAYPPPRPSGGGGATVLAMVGMSLLLVVTVISLLVAHSGDDARSAATVVVPTGTGTGTAAIPCGGGTAPQCTPPSTSGVPTTGGYTPPPTTRAYTPPPTPQSLDPGQVNSALRLYFNGLQYHDTAQVRSVTCPKFLSSIQGTYINGNEVNGWRSNSYTITPGQNYVYVLVTANLRNPNTGADAGTWVHSWDIQKLSNSRYYVCGYIS